MTESTPVVFTNPDTAAQFEALTSYDQFLDLPVRRSSGEVCWRGLLSDITPQAAARYVRLGGNLIAAKPKPPKTKTSYALPNPLQTDFTNQ